MMTMTPMGTIRAMNHPEVGHAGLATSAAKGDGRTSSGTGLGLSGLILKYGYVFCRRGPLVWFQSRDQPWNGCLGIWL